MKNYKIFVDLDGVLVDFDKKFEQELGDKPEVLFKKYGDDFVWDILDKIDNFWFDMDPKLDAEELWNFVLPYNPSILTKPAKSVYSCKKDKRKWVDKYLGEDIKVLFEQDKSKYATPNSILIDDQEKNISKWETAGGIGILHKNSQDTIKQLKEILNA